MVAPVQQALPSTSRSGRRCSAFDKNGRCRRFGCRSHGSDGATGRSRRERNHVAEPGDERERHAWMWIRSKWPCRRCSRGTWRGTRRRYAQPCGHKSARVRMVATKASFEPPRGAQKSKSCSPDAATAPRLAATGTQFDFHRRFALGTNGSVAERTFAPIWTAKTRHPSEAKQRGRNVLIVCARMGFWILQTARRLFSRGALEHLDCIPSLHADAVRAKLWMSVGAAADGARKTRCFRAVNPFGSSWFLHANIERPDQSYVALLR